MAIHPLTARTEVVQEAMAMMVIIRIIIRMVAMAAMAAISGVMDHSALAVDITMAQVEMVHRI